MSQVDYEYNTMFDFSMFSRETIDMFSDFTKNVGF